MKRGPNRNALKPTSKSSAVESLDYSRSRDLVSYTLAVNQIAVGVNKADVADMRKRFYAYVRLTAECGMAVGNQGAYSAMGITWQTAKRWLSGMRTKGHQELIEEVNQMCAMYREQTALSGEGNTIWTIFASKNYDGMKDTQDVVVEPKSFDDRSPTEIAQKYKELPE